jgi:hypothetical protein
MEYVSCHDMQPLAKLFSKRFYLTNYFKMKPNALLNWQSFIIAKSGCYNNL